MATHTTRQTAFTLLTSSRCLLRQSPASAGRLIPAARRCMHQDQQPHQDQQQQASSSRNGLSYRPIAGRIRAPFSLRGPRPLFVVNSDPEKLDSMYQALLGGDSGLIEEVKWQAVTHKSFDHGWQPYNEKLAFYGKLVLQMHTSLHHLINRPETLGPRKTYENTPATEGTTDGPVLKPFNHPDYHYLTFVNRKNVLETLSIGKIWYFARSVGLPEVVRWKPRNDADLAASGQAEVVAEALYAIIGAVALQRGGDIAGRLVRERILGVLGASSSRNE